MLLNQIRFSDAQQAKCWAVAEVCSKERVYSQARRQGNEFQIHPPTKARGWGICGMKNKAAGPAEVCEAWGVWRKVIGNKKKVR